MNSAGDIPKVLVIRSSITPCIYRTFFFTEAGAYTNVGYWYLFCVCVICELRTDWPELSLRPGKRIKWGMNEWMDVRSRCSRAHTFHKKLDENMKRVTCLL